MSDNNPTVTVDWVQSKLQLLEENALEIYNRRPDVVNSFREWSAIKLIVLSGVVELYTKIIPNWYEEFHYVDCMAGSGSVEIEGQEREYFVGSPILTAAMAHEQFNHLHLIERNSERAQALRQRMQFASDEFDLGIQGNFTVYEKDANNAIPDVRERIFDRVREIGSIHTLCFVDNEGTNVEWDSIRELSRIYSDLLINFPTTGVQQAAGANHTTDLNRFFGNRAWEGVGSDPDQLVSIYKGNLAEIDRGVSRSVRVEGSRNFKYDLIYASDETEGGNPYMRAFDYMNERLGDMHGDDIDRVLRYMKGEMVNFDPFPGPDPDQTGLSDFS